MPPVVPGICRYTILGELGDQTIANILDVEIDVQSGTRDEAIEDQADVILNEWTDHVLPLLVAEYEFNEVSWVDLDSEGGSVGETTASGSTTLPQAGTKAGDPMPLNVACLVRKEITNRARNTRSGRLYLSGIPESVNGATNPNNISANVVTEANDAFEDFKEGVEQDSNILGPYDSFISVVHNLLTSPTSSRVAAFVVDAAVASMRSRIR